MNIVLALKITRTDETSIRHMLINGYVTSSEFSEMRIAFQKIFIEKPSV